MNINEQRGIVVGPGGHVEGGARVSYVERQDAQRQDAQSLPDEPERITVLFLAADPINADPLKIQQEMRDIAQELRLSSERNRFDLRYQFAARPTDISRSLLEQKPQIIHFSGHGTSAGALCFETVSGHVQAVNPNALAALFAQFEGEIDCVLLNACYSATQAEAIARTVPCVIGMQREIGDKAAIAFAVGFYQALGAGRPPSAAFKLGCVQIQLQGIPEHLTPTMVTTA